MMRTGRVLKNPVYATRDSEVRVALKSRRRRCCGECPPRANKRRQQYVSRALFTDPEQHRSARLTFQANGHNRNEPLGRHPVKARWRSRVIRRTNLPSLVAGHGARTASPSRAQVGGDFGR